MLFSWHDNKVKQLFIFCKIVVFQNHPFSGQDCPLVGACGNFSTLSQKTCWINQENPCSRGCRGRYLLHEPGRQIMCACLQIGFTLVSLEICWTLLFMSTAFFTSRISCQGNLVSVPFVCVSLCPWGFVRPTLSTTSWGQDYIHVCVSIHHGKKDCTWEECGRNVNTQVKGLSIIMMSLKLE